MKFQFEYIFPRPFTRIKTKFTLVVTVLIFIISIFVYFFFPTWEKKQAMMAISEKAQSIAQMAAYSISPAIVFADSEGISQVITSARQNKDLAYLFVVNENDHLLGQFAPGKTGKKSFYKMQKNHSISKDNATYNVIAPVLSQGKVIGRLYLGISLRELNSRVSRSRKISGLVGLVIFLFGFIAAFSTSKVITRPLDMMVETVKQITLGDLSQRAPIISHDEVGRLAESFNLMIESLEQRTAELKLVNEQLYKENLIRKQSEHKYFSLFNQIPDAIAIFDKKTKQFLDCNSKITKIYGYSKAEFKKLTPFDLHPAEEKSKVKRLIDTRNPEKPNRYTHLSKDGRRMDVEIVSDEIEFQGRPAWLSIIRDITERLQAEKKLAKEQHLLQSFMENIPDAIYFKDMEGHFLRINRAQAKRLGLDDPKDATGKTDFDFFTEENARQVRKQELRVMRSGKISVHEQVKILADGNESWVSGTKVPLPDENGKIIGIFGITRDITERKRTEESLKIFTEKLMARNKELQEFAFIASHDLQEPLRKVRAFGDRLWAKYSDELGEQGHDYLLRMQNAAARMQTLIDDLLAYSCITIKDRPLVKTDLSRIVREVLKDFQIQIENVGAAVQLEKLPVISADPLQMRQLFQNLISNALKYHRQGVAPIIRIYNGTTGDKNSSDQEPLANGFHHIRVEDNGIGFEQKHADRIFAVFQRLHTRDSYQGTGMGLTICRKIVEHHGGSITAKSRPGEGATFTIKLPRKPENDI
ncbi:MAG: PAS domain S-box protein [Calditrichaeota bacterium]|nr:PAS domain S-box protein [Calditrichota bacterium]